jgi:quinol-cytochrome oxidoreductase complex cytochrome b subunit
MTEKHSEDQNSIPFYPDHVGTELKVVIWMTVIVLVVGTLGLWFPIGQGAPADPMDTPEHVKPEWYFLALYQLLKYIPKTAGVVIPLLGVGALILWPFFDRRQDSSRGRRARLILVVVGLAVLVAGTLLGEFS